MARPRGTRIATWERGDLAFGPLQSYVAALGGHLRIVAHFGDDLTQGISHPSTWWVLHQGCRRNPMEGKTINVD
jgi:hypothetical protein